MRPNFGSGFNQGLSTMSRFLNSEDAMQNRDIMTQARTALMSKQGSRLDEQISEMPQRLAMQQESSRQRDAFRNLQGQLIQARIKALQNSPVGGGLLNSHAPPVVRLQNMMTQLLSNAGALDQNTGKIDLDKLNPYQKQQYQQMQMAMLKLTGNTFGMKRLQQGANVLSTINSIDMEPFKYYSGAKGQAQFQKDRALSAIGKAPEMYNRYVATHGILDALGEQVGQYFGSSISQDAVNARTKMLNPSDWDTSPEAVSKSFQNFKHLVSSEVENTLQALTNPDFYTTGIGNLLSGNATTGLPVPGNTFTPQPAPQAAKSSPASGTKMVSEAKIKAAMKQFGISREKAMDILGGSDGG